MSSLCTRSTALLLLPLLAVPALGAEPTNVAGPRLVRRVAPEYPRKALAEKQQDVVCNVRVFIDTAGAPRRLELLSCPDPFRDPTIEAVRQWRWEPLVLDGVPTEAQFVLNVRYTQRPDVARADLPRMRVTRRAIEGPSSFDADVLTVDPELVRFKRDRAPFDRSADEYCHVQVRFGTRGKVQEVVPIECAQDTVAANVIASTQTWRIKPHEVDGVRREVAFSLIFEAGNSAADRVREGR